MLHCDTETGAARLGGSFLASYNLREPPQWVFGGFLSERGWREGEEVLATSGYSHRLKKINRPLLDLMIQHTVFRKSGRKFISSHFNSICFYYGLFHAAAFSFLRYSADKVSTIH